jgi:hypothetical protein
MRAPGEVVAIYRDNKPIGYTRIKEYAHDRKPGWFQVHRLLLGFPPQEMVWILREEQIDGEPFTMNDRPVQTLSVPSRRTVAASDVHSLHPGQRNGEIVSRIEKRARKRGISDEG